MMANQGEVISLLKWVADRWPNARMPKDTVAAWVDDLRDAPYDRLQDALRMYHAEGHEWPPNAGQLVAYCVQAQNGEPWPQVWARLLDHMKVCGHTCSHDKTALFGAAGAAALAAIGWAELCMTNLDGMTAVRAQFRDAYQTAQGRIARELTLQLLIQTSPLPQIGAYHG